MPRYFLRSLSVEGFRGINNCGKPLTIKFDPTKVTSVFGENGMGKSSLFEALEYAIFGKVSRLAALQQIESADRYYHNQFHPGPARIVLEFQPDDGGTPVTIKVERSKSGVRSVSGTGTPDCNAFLRNLQAETLLMDYRTFNSFLMDTPLERGRFLARLLGLQQLTFVRANLSSLSDARNLRSDLDVRTLEQQLRGAQSRRRAAATTALAQLNDIKPHTMAPDAFDVKQAASLCLAVLNSDPVIAPLVAGKSLSTIDYKACLARLQESDQSGERTRLANLQAKKGRLMTPVNLTDLNEQTNTLLMNVRKRKALVETSKGEAFRELYRAAQQIVEESGQTATCPLCERPWEHTSGFDLSDFLLDHLEDYKQLSELDTLVRFSWQSLAQDASVSKLVLELDERAPQAAPSAFISVDMPFESDVRDLKTAFEHVEEQRVTALADIQREIQELESKLPPSLAASIQAVTSARTLTETLWTYLAEERAEKAAATSLDAINQWEAYINTVASEFAQEETALVRATISNLENDIRSLYTTIMPGAPVLPKLSRQEGSEKLLLMLEQFYGVKDAHAVPLLSESYRNALGLAVFLAASRKRTYGGRFLVLDDVTSSFDAGHQTFLLDAIYQHITTAENTDGLQVIVLSHDGALKKYFDTCTNSGRRWMNHRLQGTAPTGTVQSKMIPTDELRQDIATHLSAGDLPAARRAVRPYLEASLLQIIDQVHIRVPLELATTDQKRMLADMMEAIKWEVTVRGQARDLVLDNTVVKDITQTIIPFIQANAWAHYATDSTTSVDAFAVQAVADATSRLTDDFKYTCNCDPARPVRKFYRTLSGDKQKGCKPECR